MKWVRITGVVVAVDEFKGKKVYTVDDSSGMCVECTAVAPAPPPAPEVLSMPAHLDQVASLIVAQPMNKSKNIPPKKPANAESKEKQEGEGKKISPSVQTPVVPWEDVDVGTVVKVKGRVNNYWDTIQIEVIKVEVLRCTDQEVRCWNEVMAFKRDVVGRPWVVSAEEEESCRKARERELRHARGRKVTGRGVKDGKRVHGEERKVGGGGKVADEERRKRKRLERREVEKRKESANRMKEMEEEKLRTKKSGYPSLAVRKAAAGKYPELGI